jgi:phosphoribosylamine-glycine ligase
LIVGDEAAWTAGAWRLQEMEYHDVRIYCREKEGKEHLKGMVQQVQTLEAGLSWLGRGGYVISEDEADMTQLRLSGFKVYGGNAFIKRLENDRTFEMEIAEKAGVKIPNYHAMKSVDEGIAFIKKHPDAWCLKQLGHFPKEWNYVGKDDDGHDTILQLEWIKTQPLYKRSGNAPFMLQEVVDGIEFATSAWWNGEDWLRDSDGNIIGETNREHKKMLNGDLGLVCGEMGTCARMTTEDMKLFELSVEKFTPILKEKAKGVAINFDCNCGITSDGEAYLFETTSREGYPFCSLHQHLLNTELGEFFRNLIDGVQGEVEFKKDWGVVLNIGTGSFPHEAMGKDADGSFKGQPVRFGQDWGNVMPAYISYDQKEDLYRVADDYSWVATVCHDDKDISKANERCVKDLEKIDVRSPVYRTDVGQKFAKSEIPKLVKMGFLSGRDASG